MKKPQNTEPERQVYKEAEYAVFIAFVAEGLWKNNRFLAEICGVNEETIAEWKKRSEVVALRQKSVQEDLKRWKRTADAEKRLKEQGMDFDAEKLDVSMKIIVKGLENI